MRELRKMMRRTEALLLVFIMLFSLIGCGQKDEATEQADEYKVDYCGQKDLYEGAEDSYAEGEKVSIRYTAIGTDTDYSFYLDDEKIEPKYDEKSDSYKIKFTMPDHDVKLYCEHSNGMDALPPDTEPVGTADTTDNKPLTLLFDVQYIVDEDMDYDSKWYYSSTVEFFLADDDHPELKAALDKLNKKTVDEYTKGIKELGQQAKESYEYEGLTGYENYYSNRRVSLCRADEEALSYVEYYDYDLGTMLYTTVTGRNIDPSTGREIGLDEVVTDFEALKNVVIKEGKELDYNERTVQMFGEVLDKAVGESEYFSDEYFSWNICYEGLWLHFPADLPYDIMGAKNGSNVLFVPFEGHEDMIAGRFLNVPGAYVYDIEVVEGFNDVYTMDLDGDSVYEEVVLNATPDEETGWIEQLLVIHGPDYKEQWITNGVSCFDCDGKIVHTADGKDYLYLCQTEASDYDYAAVYRIGTSFKYVDDVDGDVNGVYTGLRDDGNEAVWNVLTDPEHFVIGTLDYKMGTFEMSAYHKVGSDGMPEKTDPWWTYPGEFYSGEEYYGITTKYNIYTERVDEDGNELGPDTIYDGVKVRPYRTDDETYIDIIDVDGNIWRFDLSKSQYNEDLLNEQKADELFDGLLYAG